MSGEKTTFLTSKQRRKIRNNLTGYAFIIPNLIGYTIFVFIPVIFSFRSEERRVGKECL